jgi:chromosome segregation ATPase
MPLWGLQAASRIAGPLLLVAAGIAIGAFSAYRLTTVPAHERAEELAAAVATERASVSAALAANQTNQSTISDLELRLNALVESRRAEEARTAAELERRRQESERARREADRLREEVSRAWGTSKDCEAYRDLRVAGACPAVADRVRERSIPPGGY